VDGDDHHLILTQDLVGLFVVGLSFLSVERDPGQLHQLVEPLVLPTGVLEG
jgi:hypothetical protein